MKYFLRTAAMLASVALLFTACSEEEAEAVVDDYIVDDAIYAPEVTAVEVGFERAVIYWNSYFADGITSTTITWGTSGTKTVTVDAEEMSCEITGLTDGTYTFSLVNGDDEGKASAATTTSATVYGDAYQEALTPPTIQSMDVTTAGVTIYWSKASTDCLTKTVKHDGGTVVIPASELVTVIDGATANSEFYYYSTHQPTDGLDSVDSDKTYSVFDAATLGAVSLVSIDTATAGQVTIVWTVDDADVTSTVFSIDGGATSESDVNFTSSPMSETLTLSAGTYTITCWNEGADDASSSKITFTVTVL